MGQQQTLPIRSILASERLQFAAKRLSQQSNSDTCRAPGLTYAVARLARARDGQGADFLRSVAKQHFGELR